MFKKTKVRNILELLGKDLSGRDVPKVLGVSRNTVAEVQALFEASGKTWDDISSLDDDRLYDLFYPVDEWHERLGGGTQADSIMDRIIHNAYEIPTSEANLRKIYDTKKLKKLIDEIES